MFFKGTREQSLDSSINGAVNIVCSSHGLNGISPNKFQMDKRPVCGKSTGYNFETNYTTLN